MCLSVHCTCKASKRQANGFLIFDHKLDLEYNYVSIWLTLAQLGSAWLTLAQLGSALFCFCFTLYLSGVLSPNLASFSPKPIGHVYYWLVYTQIKLCLYYVIIVLVIIKAIV